MFSIPFDALYPKWVARTLHKMWVLGPGFPKVSAIKTFLNSSGSSGSGRWDICEAIAQQLPDGQTLESRVYGGRLVLPPCKYLKGFTGCFGHSGGLHFFCGFRCDLICILYKTTISLASK